MSIRVSFDDTAVGDFEDLMYNVPRDKDGNVSSEGINFMLKVKNANVEFICDMDNNKTTIELVVIRIHPSFAKLAKGVFLQSFHLKGDSEAIKAATFFGRFV